MRSLKRACALLLSLTLLSTLSTTFAANLDTSHRYADGGMSHTIAVRSNGAVVVFGSNQSLQLAQPTATGEVKEPTVLADFTAVSVAAGSDFSVALKEDGTVYAWGLGEDGAPTLQPIQQVISIAASQTDLLALKEDGTVWQWSYGGTPKQISGLQQIAAIEAGGSHYMALTTAGAIYTWGSNSRGQLGDGTTTDRTKPGRVEGLVSILDVAAGVSHSLAVGFDGTVYAWGSNQYGQLGNSSEKDSALPVVTEQMPKAVRVAAGNDSSMALTAAGHVYTWGYGEYGQLGYGSNRTIQNRPIQTTELKDVVFISAGLHHDLAVTKNGALYTWGRNKSYQLGHKQNTNSTFPQLATSGIAQESHYTVDMLKGVSNWARPTAAALYDASLVPPLLWGQYQSNITRAEMAHLLVSLYEGVKETSAVPAMTTQYKDLKGNALETDIRKAHSLGIIGSTGGNTMSPDRTVTRAEAAKMLCAFLTKTEGISIPAKGESLNAFKDYKEISDWATPYVSYVYYNDIMTGISEGFSPNSMITREQMLVIIQRLVEKYGWSK